MPSLVERGVASLSPTGGIVIALSAQGHSRYFERVSDTLDLQFSGATVGGVVQASVPSDECFTKLTGSAVFEAKIPALWLLRETPEQARRLRCDNASCTSSG